jgi:hypothetical protein
MGTPLEAATKQRLVKAEKTSCVLLFTVIFRVCNSVRLSKLFVVTPSPKSIGLLGLQSKLSTSIKLLIYKPILKPIWTYGIQLWGRSSTSKLEILDRFQPKALRLIVDAPWLVQDTGFRRDLHAPTVIEEIRRYSSQYSACLSAHPNDLVGNLIKQSNNGRLRRLLLSDLPTRLLV